MEDNTMVHVERTFTVRRPRKVVVDYLRDFAHAEAWDPGTQRCVRSTPGPIGVGTEWHNESKLAGISTELTYRLVEDRQDVVEFEGRNKTATTVDHIAFEDAGDDSTRITYVATITFNGLAKLSDPVFKLIFERIGDKTVDAMTRTLEGL
ncbi:polyketide cyclase [Rhodococcus sp. 15-649-1-2]|nr:polyketide cyclase [Rhodococcus sp. 06-621-2]OZC92856.1 polyketide cyclase [Rhodococcus sp. 06-418-1B]OZD07581.1 polyketide cyclase [Rhodococcus sp. 06-156-4C]OZD17210.1 polyketide cyclase [Rhodococcus sp. 06-156-3C]OZD18548.1 polyketide cyclase [Rhodococcus sp. 06-156-4a]OZD28252.1 polyketide cyclase [Rhodococcus sp. 06-156-3]OZD29979.1 polyketide cyclase [Rhodococcus sp. 06-156-3b]OZE87058.1 polyketide cyclase [Rhodococcus sp. 15-649-1-2]OZF57914.1 polyketide cyclase [Rhodococcus sp. 0